MVSWVVTCRSTLRRSRKSHPLYVLTPSPRAAVPSRLADVPKSLPFNLFADPHPLNPAPSIFYKKGGGEGCPRRPDAPFASRKELRKVPACFGPIPFAFISLQTLLHLRKAYLLCFQAIPNSLPKTTRGGGTPNVQTFNLQTFKRSERPIAAYAPWCHNWQWRTKSSPSGETTPLPPVSNDSERTSGTARSWSPTQVVPRSSVLELDRLAGWLASSKRVGKAGSVRLG